MSTYKTIRYEIDERGVATLTLARPDKHNAMNEQMIADLSQAAGRIAADSSVRVCVLQAEGKSFCAGGDLEWMQLQMSKSREEKMAGALALTQMLRALDELPCLLIGKIQGSAYGGGIGLMAVCDVVIASPNIGFALSETRLGLIPATIAPFVLRRIGEARARRYFYTGSPFNVETAMKMNLISQCQPANCLDQAVAMEVDNILKCLPGAVRAAKELVRELARNPSMESRELTASKLADRWESDEAQQAIKAFFEARK